MNFYLVLDDLGPAQAALRDAFRKSVDNEKKKGTDEVFFKQCMKGLFRKNDTDKEREWACIEQLAAFIEVGSEPVKKLAKKTVKQIKRAEILIRKNKPVQHIKMTPEEEIFVQQYVQSSLIDTLDNKLPQASSLMRNALLNLKSLFEMPNLKYGDLNAICLEIHNNDDEDNLRLAEILLNNVGMLLHHETDRKIIEGCVTILSWFKKHGTFKAQLHAQKLSHHEKVVENEKPVREAFAVATQIYSVAYKNNQNDPTNDDIEKLKRCVKISAFWKIIYDSFLIDKGESFLQTVKRLNAFKEA